MTAYARLMMRLIVDHPDASGDQLKALFVRRCLEDGGLFIDTQIGTQPAETGRYRGEEKDDTSLAKIINKNTQHERV